MGDVYKAMQKARQAAERPDPDEDRLNPAADSGTPENSGTSATAGTPEAAPPADPSQSEAGSLPMDQVSTASVFDEDRAGAFRDDDEFEQQAADQPEPDSVTAQAGSTDAAEVSDDSSSGSDTVSRALKRSAAAPKLKPIRGADNKRKYQGSLNGYSKDVVAHHDRGSVITEQYRSIRTQILARGRTRKLQIHTISSSLPGEGKTITTINLGITFAELSDKNTLIIEADLRCPAFSKLLDRECKPGLLGYLEGKTDEIDDIIEPTVYDNFQFIGAGGMAADRSTQLLSSPRMHRLLDRLRDRYDHIFIDTPPVISVTDACILGAASDQVMLVVQLNRTTNDAVERAKRLLKAGHCEISGVILTHQTEHTEDYYTSKYSRYYRSKK